MSLLLTRPSAELHHRWMSRRTLSQGEQHLSSMLPVGGDLGLSGEHHCVPGDRAAVPALVQEREPGQPEDQTWGENRGDLGELLALSMAVHHEQVAAGSEPDRLPRGRHTNSRQTGDQDGSMPTVPQVWVCQDRLNDRPRAAQQHNVGFLLDHLPRQASGGKHGHGSAGRR